MIVLYSGGLDSFIVARLLAHRDPYHTRALTSLLYARVGARYERMEMACMEAVTDGCHEVGVEMQVRITQAVQVGAHEDARTGHIPLRNLALLVGAVAEYPRESTFVLGAVRGEVSRDLSPRFMRRTSREFSWQLQRRVRISAPFRSVSKTELVRQYLAEFPGTEHLLSLTRSCYGMVEYDRSLVGCGSCPSCLRRWVAMTNNGITERYWHDPRKLATSLVRDEWWQAVGYALANVRAGAWLAAYQFALDTRRAIEVT